jgi:hypothetical protein
MKKEFLRFRDIFLYRMCESLKERFSKGEFDRAIEGFLDGKVAVVDTKNVFDGTQLSDLTKATIAALPTPDAIRRFNEAVTKEEKTPATFIDKTKKGKK